MSQPSPTALSPEERIRELEAENDILARGGSRADVVMVRTIAKRVRGYSFSAREIGLASGMNGELAEAIAGTLGPAWSIKALGKRLRKLHGGVVERQDGGGGADCTWRIRWPLSVSGPQTDTAHSGLARSA